MHARFTFVVLILLTLTLTLRAQTTIAPQTQVNRPGPVNAPAFNGALNAVAFTGTGNNDIFDKANAAIATCAAGNAQHPNGCGLRIPAASVPFTCYPASTSLHPPVSVNGHVRISWDDGACVYFYGPNPAVDLRGGALPNIGVELVSPRIIGVASATSLDAPNTTSPGGILIGHWEGITLYNPTVTGFRGTPMQIGKGSGAFACGICTLGTDGLTMFGGEVSDNADNIRLDVGDGYGTNNTYIAGTHMAGATHRNINAVGWGSGNRLDGIGIDPPNGAEEVIGYFHGGIGNTLSVKYSEGAKSQLSGYTPANGTLGYYAIVADAAVMRIEDLHTGLTNLTADLLVDTGGIVDVTQATSGDFGTNAFFDYGPNSVGHGRPSYIRIWGWTGFGYATGSLGPGHNPHHNACLVLFGDSPSDANNLTGNRDHATPATPCATISVDPYSGHLLLYDIASPGGHIGTAHWRNGFFGGRFDTWTNGSTTYGYADDTTGFHFQQLHAGNGATASGASCTIHAIVDGIITSATCK